MPQLLGGGAYLINSNWLPLPQPAYKKNQFLFIFCEHWLSVSIDPIRVKGGVLHSNFLFSLKLFLQLEMTSSDKAVNHWSNYSIGSRFVKIIAYGIGAKLTILAGFMFYMMAN